MLLCIPRVPVMLEHHFPHDCRKEKKRKEKKRKEKKRKEKTTPFGVNLMPHDCTRL